MVDTRRSHLLMLVGGFVFCAGAGKSKVVAAFLWHMFQHGASDKVLVTSYTWKAASLIGTAYNPGYSTCRVFGVNPHKKYQAAPGNAPESRSLLNRNVALFLNDECSFCEQAHMKVRRPPRCP